PVVDLREYIDGSKQDKEKFVEAAGSALEDIGFFALAGHGVDAGLVEKAYAMAFEFFELPLEVKTKYEEVALKGQRGYTSFGREHAKDHKAPDLKEFWHVGPELGTSHPRYSEYPKNLWPHEIKEFKRVMLDLYRQLESCSMSLLEACSLYV